MEEDEIEFFFKKIWLGTNTQPRKKGWYMDKATNIWKWLKMHS